MLDIMNEIKSYAVKDSIKDGFVDITIAYKNGRTITGSRKLSERKNCTYVLIDGLKMYIRKVNKTDLRYICYDIERVYETDEKRKVRSSTDTLSKKTKKCNIKNDIKKELEKNKVETKKIEVVEEKKPELEKGVKHSQYDIIKSCVEMNIPVYLYGPAGSGKNYTLEAIAKEMGLDFYFTNSVQQEYKLTGFIDAGGNYHETEFYKAFKNGGLFFLDEMDASIPEVLVLLNAAIANGYFEFPNGKITANKNFRVVAAGNTVGSGADELYTGRLVLDQATLDRFAIIEFNYDRNVEMSLANGNKELVDFVERLRKTSADTGIRTTFSYRCIMMVTKLEKTKMELDKILLIAVVKGLDKDTIRTLKGYNVGNNKYEKALEKLAQAA